MRIVLIYPPPWKIPLPGKTPYPPEEGPPGETLAVDRRGVVVACGSGTALRLLDCQGQGRRRMAASDFARGLRLAPGDRWGEKRP